MAAYELHGGHFLYSNAVLFEQLEICQSNLAFRRFSSTRHPPISPSADAVVLQWELVVFPQRMTGPVFRAEDAPEVRMIQKLDAHQIVGFAFVPIGNRPQPRHGIHLRDFAFFSVLPAREFDFDHQRMFLVVAGKVIDDFHVRLVGERLGFFGVGFTVIDAAQVVQMIERQPGVVLQERRDLQNSRGRDFNPRVGRFQIGPGDFGLAELFEQELVDFGCVHAMVFVLDPFRGRGATTA